MELLVRTALVCGVVPLVVGTLIYVAWWASRSDALMMAGFMTIGGGVLAFIVGVACLVLQPWNAERDAAACRRLRWQGASAAILLLVNFPVALFYIVSADDIITRYTIRVVNDSDRPIDSLVVTGPSVRDELGPIGPGHRVYRHLYFVGDGPLYFSARQQELQFGGEVEGYVTGGLGGEKTIRIGPTGDYHLDGS